MCSKRSRPNRSWPPRSPLWLICSAPARVTHAKEAGRAMARILPDAPTGAISPEAARIHRLLKRLPDEEYTVWQRLTIWAEPGPDFWVLHADGRGMLLKVSSATG